MEIRRFQMANSLTTNPIVLDTFTSDINISTGAGFVSGQPIYVEWIKWQTPVAVSDACEILDGSGGTQVFYELCAVAKQSVINYFHGEAVKNIYIATSGVASGKVVILLSKNKAG
jgi:hypothetical protein